MKRLLVVDDVFSTVRGTVAELRGEGIHVDHADNVESAIEWLKAEQYDAVLLDWRIPLKQSDRIDNDGGGTLLERIEEGAAGDTNRNTRVLVVTAYNDGVDRYKLKRFKNCRGVIQKMTLGPPEIEMQRIFG